MDDPVSLSYLDDAWPAVEGVMDILIEYSLSEPMILPSPKELSTCYAAVYNICFQSSSFTDQVYKRFGHAMDELLRAKVAPRLRVGASEDLLLAVVDLWCRFVKVRGWLKTVFAYVDRHYCKALHMLPLDRVGTNSFRILVLEPAMPQIRKALDARISALRLAATIGGGVVSRVMEVLVSSAHGKLFFYEREFEEAFVKRSMSYYQTLRLELFEAHKECDLLAQVGLAIERETEVLAVVLSPESDQTSKLVASCEAALNFK